MRIQQPGTTVSVPFRGSCSEMLRASHGNIQRLCVSVPFRGSCSEITQNGYGKHGDSRVSVPFRGSCSEICYLLIGIDDSDLSFRPLSGFVF